LSGFGALRKEYSLDFLFYFFIKKKVKRFFLQNAILLFCMKNKILNSDSVIL